MSLNTAYTASPTFGGGEVITGVGKIYGGIIDCGASAAFVDVRENDASGKIVYALEEATANKPKVYTNGIGLAVHVRNLFISVSANGARCRLYIDKYDSVTPPSKNLVCRINPMVRGVTDNLVCRITVTS